MIYKTRQSEAILDYIKQQKERYVTAYEISQYFKSCGISVGLTTIYRRLERLTEQGLIRKYNLDGSSSACFKAIENDDKFLLKCEDCGDLVRFNCRDLEHLYAHFNSKHHFAINPYKTVFYGKCDKCKEGKI